MRDEIDDDCRSLTTRTGLVRYLSTEQRPHSVSLTVHPSVLCLSTTQLVLTRREKDKSKASDPNRSTVFYCFIVVIFLSALQLLLLHVSRKRMK